MDMGERAFTNRDGPAWDLLVSPSTGCHRSDNDYGRRHSGLLARQWLESLHRIPQCVRPVFAQCIRHDFYG